MSEADAARKLVRMAKEQGLSLTGPDGLPKQLTKTVRPWDNTWEEFIPFLDSDVEIRRVICSSYAIAIPERQLAARRQGLGLPTEQAVLKCLYLVTRSLDPTGAGWTRWAVRWKPILKAFAISFSDRRRRARPRARKKGGGFPSSFR